VPNKTKTHSFRLFHSLIQMMSIYIPIFFDHTHHQANQLHPELQILQYRCCHSIFVWIFALLVVITEHRAIVVEKIEISFNAILKIEGGFIFITQIFLSLIKCFCRIYTPTDCFFGDFAHWVFGRC